MKIRTLVLVFAGLLIVPIVWSQVGHPSVQALAKVGTINVQAAIAGTAEGKQDGAELQSQFASRSAELQNMQKQIEDLRARVINGQTTLSDEEKLRLQQQGDRLARTFQRRQQDFQEDLNDAQQDLVQNIGRKMLTVLDKYSKENGYSVVVDTSSQQTPVVYGAPEVDVTQEIIRLYDLAYPSKASTAQPGGRPAAPRPAQPAPKP
jgi:outer membrane protein